MAGVQRNLDNVTRTAAKTRQAVSGLGAAMRMPGLGRAGAFGGFASGAAGALGIGALGGGVAGIAGTAGFLLINTIVSDIAKKEQLRIAHNAKIAEQVERQAAAFQAQVDARAELAVSAQRIVDATLEPGGEKARAERERLLGQINTLDAEAAKLRRSLTLAIGLRTYFGNRDDPDFDVEGFQARLDRIAQAREVLTNGVSDAGRGTSSILRGTLDSIEPRENPLARALREGAAAQREAAESAKRSQETQKDLAEALEGWTREMQRDFGNLATSVGKIGNQVDYFARKRH